MSLAIRIFVTMLCVGAVGCRIERVSPRARDATAPCADESASGEVWVYTSMYQHVIDALDPILRKRLPQVQVRWYRAGSEKVSNRLEAELASGGMQADLVATSDPFVYERFKRAGELLPYASIHALRLPASLVDDGGYFAVCRISTMVIVHRRDAERVPSSFRALTEPQFRGRVAIGDPLTSGTASTWAVFVSASEGADYFAALRRNHVTVAGGNSAVLRKVENGEAEIGVLLLENALAAVERGSQIDIVYPDDGAVLIPGFLGILKGTNVPAAARAVYDVLLSQEGQRVMLAGKMHAADPSLPGPDAQPGLAKLLESARPWGPKVFDRGLSEGAEIKQRFSEAFSR